MDATAELQHLIRSARHDLLGTWIATSHTALLACEALSGDEHRLLRTRLFATAIYASRNLGLVEMSKEEWGWVTAMKIVESRAGPPSRLILKSGKQRVLAAHVSMLEQIAHAAGIDLPENEEWVILR